MNKYYYLVALLLTVSLTGLAQAIDENNGFYFGATSTQPAKQYQGFQIKPNWDITVQSVTKTANATGMTNAIITNSSGHVLPGANATLSGNVATFATGINLTKGVTYYVGIGHNVTSSNRYSTGGLPKTGGAVNWTLGAYNLDGFGLSVITDVTNAWNVQSIQYTNQTVAGTVAAVNNLPLNNTYTSNVTPPISFNITSISGTWNATLMINNVSYGTYNTITTTGTYTINSSTLTAGAEYYWYINLTSTVPLVATPVQTGSNKFYLTGGSSSCVLNLGLAYFRPNSCTVYP